MHPKKKRLLGALRSALGTGPAGRLVGPVHVRFLAGHAKCTCTALYHGARHAQPCLSKLSANPITQLSKHACVCKWFSVFASAAGASGGLGLSAYEPLKRRALASCAQYQHLRVHPCTSTRAAADWQHNLLWTSCTPSGLRSIRSTASVASRCR